MELLFLTLNKAQRLFPVDDIDAAGLVYVCDAVAFFSYQQHFRAKGRAYELATVAVTAVGDCL